MVRCKCTSLLNLLATSYVRMMFYWLFSKRSLHSKRSCHDFESAIYILTAGEMPGATRSNPQPRWSSELLQASTSNNKPTKDTGRDAPDRRTLACESNSETSNVSASWDKTSNNYSEVRSTIQASLKMPNHDWPVVKSYKIGESLC